MDVRPLSLAVAALLGATAACGPEPGPASASGSATTSDSHGATSATDAPATDGAPTTGASACDAFRSTPDIGPSVTITVENQSAEPVWLASAIETWGCGPLPALDILDGDGVSLQYLGEHCSPWDCASLMKLSDCTSNCNNCGVSDIVRMEAGARTTVTWPGNRLTAMTMTPECASGTTCQRDCKRVDQAAPGTYTLRLVAHRACDGECVCHGSDSDGFCPVYGLLTLAAPEQATAQLDYPGETAITVVIPPA
jgi:hypothetical protein